MKKEVSLKKAQSVGNETKRIHYYRQNDYVKIVGTLRQLRELTHQMSKKKERKLE